MPYPILYGAHDDREILRMKETEVLMNARTVDEFTAAVQGMIHALEALDRACRDSLARLYDRLTPPARVWYWIGIWAGVPILDWLCVLEGCAGVHRDEM